MLPGSGAARTAVSGRKPDRGRRSDRGAVTPIARVQDGSAVRDFTVSEAQGEEKAMLQRRVTGVWRKYESYQTVTTRQIALFVLEPAER
jgi:hypothetical protein